MVFAAETGIALATHKPFSLGFWSWMAAAETAAWHLKWAMIPLTFLVAFGCRKIYRSILEAPDNFCAPRYARNGYIASAIVPVLVLLLIGITVPARLVNRQISASAAEKARGFATARLLLQYRDSFGKYPVDKKNLTDLPDPDGSIAALLKEIESSEYKPSAEVAAVPKKNPRPLRGEVIRKASLSTVVDEPLSEGLSVTNYELRLPGNDKIVNTEDDLIVRDGMVYRISDTPLRGANASAAQPHQR
jgi:hypothetical protein